MKFVKKLLPFNFQFSTKSGFSLLELLIVIGIFAILSLFLSLNLFSLSQRKNIDNDTQKIAFILRAAHDKSVEQENSAQWGVHFENATSSQGFFDIFSGNYSSSSVSSHITLSSNNVFINPAKGTVLEIIFSKETGLPSSTSSIIIALDSNNAVSSTITVLPEGQVQY